MGDWVYFVVPVVMFLPVVVAIYVSYRVRKKEFAEFKTRLRNEGRKVVITIPGGLRNKDGFCVPRTSNALPMSMNDWYEAGEPPYMWFRVVRNSLPDYQTREEIARHIVHVILESYDVPFQTRQCITANLDECEHFAYNGNDFLSSTVVGEISGERRELLAVSIDAMILGNDNAIQNT